MSLVRLRGWLAVLALLALAACGAAASVGGGGAAPLPFAGQRVLVLPTRADPDLAPLARRLDAELHFALQERDTTATWLPPSTLRESLARSPGFAPDPAALPADRHLERGDEPVGEALGSVLRRYAALVGSRLVVAPHLLPFAGEGAGGLQLRAAVVDARTGNVLWRGGVRSVLPVDPAAPELAKFAAAWAASLVRVPAP